ncbi:MAG: hypothetical protein BalsKO_13710 [Balneolaceae bacterium]
MLGFALTIQSCEKKAENLEKVILFNEQLSKLASESKNELFSTHLKSIQHVLEGEKEISPDEAELIEHMYDTFLNDSLANPSDFESYLSRERTLIIAWTSPTDDEVSFAWLRLPKDWDSEKEYPLYVHLHGYWDVADQPISYMSYTFIESPSTTYAYEDGYWLSPWGRGNKWYQGISKTDVWEAIIETERLTKIDPTRKYLSGHSMGGFGTWKIAQESNNYWAAIGIHSGALWYDELSYIEPEFANNLKDMPVYFVWGDKEDIGLIESNEKALELLKEAGNLRLAVTTFDGGHDYNEADVENMYVWMREFRQNNR